MMENGRTFIFLGLLVLVMFYSPGSALKCYNCEDSGKHCTKNVTCKNDEDACLQVTSGEHYYYSCWKFADCKIEKIGEVFKVPIAQYSCCQNNLCNDAGMGYTLSKTTMIFALFVAMLWGFPF